MEVTREDQDAINEFSRQNVALDDSQAALRAARDRLDELEELSTELELADEDDGPVMFKIDTTFVNMKPSEALERVSGMQQSINDEIATIETAVSRSTETMEKLKVQLYAKFGKNINLERDL